MKEIENNRRYGLRAEFKLFLVLIKFINFIGTDLIT
jgi:hypothetical protein